MRQLDKNEMKPSINKI